MICVLGVKYKSINVKAEIKLEEKLILLSAGSFRDHVGYQRAEKLTAVIANLAETY